MSKLNNWFIRPHKWKDTFITEVKLKDDYKIDNGPNSLERRLDPDFESGFGQSVKDYRYTPYSVLQTLFQGIDYGKGTGDGASNLRGVLVNNNNYNICLYEDGLGHIPGLLIPEN